MYVRTRLQAYVCLLTHALLHMCVRACVCVCWSHACKIFRIIVHAFLCIHTYIHMHMRVCVFDFLLGLMLALCN